MDYDLFIMFSKVNTLVYFLIAFSVVVIDNGVDCSGSVGTAVAV